MSSHPSAILACVIKPKHLTRQTCKAIFDEAGKSYPDDQIEIGGLEYWGVVMESGYDEGWQISAPEGSIVFHDFLTYGYGDTITWSDMEKRKNDLEAWAKGICERHQCDYEIIVTANYW